MIFRKSNITILFVYRWYIDEQLKIINIKVQNKMITIDLRNRRFIVKWVKWEIFISEKFILKILRNFEGRALKCLKLNKNKIR